MFFSSLIPQPREFSLAADEKVTSYHIHHQKKLPEKLFATFMSLTQNDNNNNTTGLINVWISKRDFQNHDWKYFSKSQKLIKLIHRHKYILILCYHRTI